MHRLLILLSILPILAALICRKFFADRALQISDEKPINHDAQQLVRKMLDSMQHQGVELKIKKSPWAGNHSINKASLTLSPEIASDISTRAHGKAALDVGLFLLSRRNPEIVARRQWALRFGQVFPIFTTIVAVFALVVAKLNVSWLLAIMVTSLGAASCAQLLTLMANLQAADLASIVMEKKRIYPRLHDEEAVIKKTKAWAWHGIAPGILSRFM